MNDYKVCSFEVNSAKEYLVLEVIIDAEKKQANLQGFKSKGGCSPFPLYFTPNVSEAEILKEAFLDGTNRMKDSESWKGSECEESLKSLEEDKLFLDFIKTHCKSEKLASDIDFLLNKNP
jgi:hypothetical protein